MVTWCRAARAQRDHGNRAKGSGCNGENGHHHAVAQATQPTRPVRYVPARTAVVTACSALRLVARSGRRTVGSGTHRTVRRGAHGLTPAVAERLSGVRCRLRSCAWGGRQPESGCTDGELKGCKTRLMSDELRPSASPCGTVSTSSYRSSLSQNHVAATMIDTIETQHAAWRASRVALDRGACSVLDSREECCCSCGAGADEEGCALCQVCDGGHKGLETQKPPSVRTGAFEAITLMLSR